MSTSSRVVAAVLGAAGLAVTFAAEGPNLGSAPAASTIAAADISIPPDGAGLPAGSGSAAAGERLFRERCAVCHGEKGQDGPHDRLAGGHGSLPTERAVKTVGSFWPYATTVFDYVRRTMPYFQPRTLTDDETYAVTAYLLYVNGIIGRDDVMNGDSLPKVKMPNREGFVWTTEAPRAD